MHQFIFLIRLFLFLPLFPFLKRDGKKVRANVPQLQEPIDTQGNCPRNAQPEHHILFIGESTIAGVGVDHHADGIAGQFCQKYHQRITHPCSWTVVAKSGYTSKQVNKKLLQHIPIKNYQVILIGLGANDAFTLNSPRRWNKEINKLILSLKSKFENTPILFLSMPPIKEFPAMTSLLKFVVGSHVDLLGAALRSQFKNYDEVYYNYEKIRLNTWSKKYNLPMDDPTVYFSDGIHPSKKTYEVWAESALEFLIERKVLGS